MVKIKITYASEINDCVIQPQFLICTQSLEHISQVKVMGYVKSDVGEELGIVVTLLEEY